MCSTYNKHVNSHYPKIITVYNNSNLIPIKSQLTSITSKFLFAIDDNY